MSIVSQNTDIQVRRRRMMMMKMMIRDPAGQLEMSVLN